MALALQQVLVLGVVSQPAEQGLAGVVPHAGVGQAHRQGHQGREVVGVELQTPGRRQGSRVEQTSKGNSDLTGINWDGPEPWNIRRGMLISALGRRAADPLLPSAPLPAASFPTWGSNEGKYKETSG